MILVDSCVWIDLLRGNSTPEVGFLEQIQKTQNQEICISGIIQFEVLRGIPKARQRNRIQNIFQKLEHRNFDHTSYRHMLDHDFTCRQKGITLNKLGDWLIVQTALDHGLEVLTSDQDLRRIAGVLPLRLVTL